jgi:regulator of protease activity HflC (stomatin/prohibitin superfamily)
MNIRLPSWVLALVLLSTGCATASIGDGELGVVRTPAGVSGTPLETGDWHIGASDTVTRYNARSQQADERLEVLASNGLKIILDASVRFHIVPDDVVKLDKEIGVDYYAVLIRPTLSSQARRVVGRFQPEEIYSSQRDQIEKQIFEGVANAIKGRHVQLEAVLIRNVQLPDTIQAAINDKLQQEQSALKMKYVIAQAQSQSEKDLLEQKAQAERKKISADSDAEALRIQAQSRADAKRIEGQAMADYQKALKQNLTDGVLRYYQIQATRDLASAPSSKLVFIGGGAPQPLLDLRGAGMAAGAAVNEKADSAY